MSNDVEIRCRRCEQSIEHTCASPELKAAGMNELETLIGGAGFFFLSGGLFLTAIAWGEWPANGAYWSLTLGLVLMVFGVCGLLYATLDEQDL
jgi:hypothetical protein